LNGGLGGGSDDVAAQFSGAAHNIKAICGRQIGNFQKVDHLSGSLGKFCREANGQVTNLSPINHS